MKTIRKLRLPGLVLAVACAANGAPITVIFGGSAQTPPPPPVFGLNTVTFNGTLMNTAASPVFLNAATVQVPGFGPGDFDLNPFFANAPASLAGGAPRR